MGYSKLSIQDVEGAGPGGAFHFVRRELGVLAFGVNWIELPAGAEGREHEESDSGPETTRCPVAGPEGLTLIAIGAPRGAYEPHGPF